MAKGDKHRGGEDNAPETPKVERWAVKAEFYDNVKKRIVKVGEEVVHTDKREYMDLIQKIK